MATWSTEAKAENLNLGNSRCPACWEDNGKIYCKGQGEYDINVYDIAMNTWSLLATLPGGGDLDRQIFEAYAGGAYPIKSEQLWVAGNYLYITSGRWYIGGVGETGYMSLGKYNIADGSKVSIRSVTELPSTNNLDGTGYFGTNRHNSFVKTISKYFYINWELKQIWEFIPASNTFVQRPLTWPTSNNWLTCYTTQGGPQAWALGDDIYLCGSGTFNQDSTSQQIYAFNINDNTFTAKGAVDTNLSNASAYLSFWPRHGTWFNIGNMFYWHGGIYATTQSGGYQIDDITVTKLMSFNPNTGDWTQVNDLPSTPYLGHSVVTSGSSAYFIGGSVNGSLVKATTHFTYFLGSPIQAAPTYNPSTGSVTVHWTDSSGDSPDGYVVERATIGVGTWAQVGSTAGSATSYEDTTAQLETDGYYYRVKSFKTAL